MRARGAASDIGVDRREERAAREAVSSADEWPRGARLTIEDDHARHARGVHDGRFHLTERREELRQITFLPVGRYFVHCESNKQLGRPVACLATPAMRLREAGSRHTGSRSGCAGPRKLKIDHSRSWYDRGRRRERGRASKSHRRVSALPVHRRLHAP